MSSVGLQRTGNEKFYTKPKIVNLCFEQLKTIKIDPTKDIVIEPSAGNGAFIQMIKQICKNYQFYDLEPEHPEIIKQDFLNFDPSKNLKKQNKSSSLARIHLIGNPPFGRQSTLARAFIQHSCQFADTISFILPKSFKKSSFQRAFELNFHLISQIDLPENSFMTGKTEYDVPCVFQIWEKRQTLRDVPELPIPIGFQFVKKEDNPDLSIRRVGVNAGTITQQPEDKSQQSHYFLKITNHRQKIKHLIEHGLEFDFNNTVGPKSISKPELIVELNRFFEET